MFIALLTAPASATNAPAGGSAELFAETLHAVRSAAPHDARALWLDARHLRWAVPGGTVRVRLLGAVDAGLQAAPGTLAGGMQQALVLEPAAAPALKDAARFSHVTGATWWVGDADAPRLPDLWRGQLVIVAEDAQGRVLDATGTQLAGALDDCYGPAATALDFGAHPSDHGTLFLLWAPTAQAVAVSIYDNPSGPARAVLPMQRDSASGSWRLTTPENLCRAPRLNTLSGRLAAKLRPRC